MSTYSEILIAAMNLSAIERRELALTLKQSVIVERDAVPRHNLAHPGQSDLAHRSTEATAGTATFSTYEQMRERARRAAGHDD